MKRLLVIAAVLLLASCGRQVDLKVLEDIQSLLDHRPRRRDLLIEHLHLIQDRYGHISAPHLAALAAEMKMAQAEVYEVATFYAHFDVIKEGETPPPPVTVRVCDSLSCAMAGAERLLKELPGHVGADVRVVVAVAGGPPRRDAVDQLAPVLQHQAAAFGARHGQRRRRGLHLAVGAPDVRRALFEPVRR